MSLELARKDIKEITQGDDWGVDLTFTPPVGSSVQVRGLGSKHHLSIDQESGLPINSRNVHMSVVESVLTDAGYTVRNAADEVSIKDHRVSFKDFRGVLRNYKINQTWPDETLGLIVCQLGAYN